MDTVASFASSATAVDIATTVAERLDDDGHRCSRVTALDGAATFTTRIRRLSILVVVYPDRSHSDRWVLTIGSGTLPSARLIGMKDDDQRAELGASIDAALRDASIIGPVEWHTDDAWEIMRPPPPPRVKHGWWSRQK